MFLRRFSTLVRRLIAVADLPISPLLKKSMEKLKFTTLTPVQEKTVGPALTENGLVVRAKTGTGKTLAFVLPTLQAILDNRVRGSVSTLVVAPTRDLALQIDDEYHKIISKLPPLARVRTALIMGGKPGFFDPYNPPDVVIATAGRLNADLRNPRIAEAFQKLQYRVYDEADRLLEGGFEEELQLINAKLPENFKLLLFSATLDDKVTRFATDVMGPDYTYINCVDETESEAHENIHQTLVVTKDHRDSFELAMAMVMSKIDQPGFKGLLFLPTKTAVSWMTEALRMAGATGAFGSKVKIGPKVWMLSLSLTQRQRDRTVRQFKAARSGLLIATDVAARGMDFPGVTDVIMPTPSVEVADYVHKIGRTARAGTKGSATLFLTEGELKYRRALFMDRGIEFSDEMTSDVFAKPDNLWLQIAPPETETNEFFSPFLSYQKQMSTKHKLNHRKLVVEAMEFYRAVVGDPERRLLVSSNVYYLYIGLPRDEAVNYFLISGREIGMDRNNTSKKQKRTTFDGYRGSSRRPERFENKGMGNSNRWNAMRDTRGYQKREYEGKREYQGKREFQGKREYQGDRGYQKREYQGKRDGWDRDGY